MSFLIRKGMAFFSFLQSFSAEHTIGALSAPDSKSLREGPVLPPAGLSGELYALGRSFNDENAAVIARWVGGSDKEANAIRRIAQRVSGNYLAVIKFNLYLLTAAGDITFIPGLVVLIALVILYKKHGFQVFNVYCGSIAANFNYVKLRFVWEEVRGCPLQEFAVVIAYYHLVRWHDSSVMLNN